MSETQKAASDLAIAVAKGEKKETGQTVKDPEGGRDVPAVLLTPKLIFKENVKDVIADGFVTKDEVCAGTGTTQRMLALIGEAGVGKSRIAEWLCEQVHESGRMHPLRARSFRARPQKPGVHRRLIA